ncbi:MAG: helicase [Acidobacteria bacterium]|nr:MAG: helicase [Acidobacteriota bacterium]
MNNGPLIVQSDKTVLLETDNSAFASARDALGRFAELVKSPEHFHTYRITPLSLWNARSAGMTFSQILETLESYGRYAPPQNVVSEIRDFCGRYGRLKLRADGEELLLESEDAILLAEVSRHKLVAPFIQSVDESRGAWIRPGVRGHVKQALLKAGFPVEDLAGYRPGDHLDLHLRQVTAAGEPLALRPYQQQAVDAFVLDGSPAGGNGVIVLPCGAGKTLVGMAVMERIGAHTLILVTNVSSIHQWRRELLDKTDLAEGAIAEYSGEHKEIAPVTLATYNILTHRKRRDADFSHFSLFDRANWGLIIYDEVHLLPAPIFRATAELQARRRLGLTATLLREDKKEDEVFSLIGPKRFDVPWKVLEQQSWIAEAECIEIRVPLAPAWRMAYATAEETEKYRLGSVNPLKTAYLPSLLERHAMDSVLVIGHYLEQLQAIAETTGAPLITGQTSYPLRDSLYEQFRNGSIRLLIVSKVANFSIDLPDANVAIQVSGTFGSRQEEAQRLGRILRPKPGNNRARFYSLVTHDTRDEEFSRHRQLFLTEQGYRYRIELAQITPIAARDLENNAGAVTASLGV